MEESFTYQRLKFLAGLGFRPKTVLDIGAYRGDWTKMCKEIFPASNIFMIEATPDKERDLESVGEAAGYEMALLGDRPRRRVKFYIANPKLTNIATGNSIYQEKTRYFDSRHHLNLPMTTLDLVIEKRKLENIDFIKMDTQGSELSILKGGRKTLKSAEFVLLETQNLEYNKNAPYAEEVVLAMKGYGFRLFDILEVHYLPSGYLFQIDLLFAKIGSKFFKKGSLL